MKLLPETKRVQLQCKEKKKLNKTKTKSCVQSVDYLLLYVSVKELEKVVVGGREGVLFHSRVVME